MVILNISYLFSMCKHVQVVYYEPQHLKDIHYHSKFPHLCWISIPIGVDISLIGLVYTTLGPRVCYGCRRITEAVLFISATVSTYSNSNWFPFKCPNNHETICYPVRHQYTMVQNTVKCHYNAIQFIMISFMAPWWEEQNLNQISNSQQTPHTSPSRASYGVSIVRILEKTDHVIMVPHCSIIWYAVQL